MRRTSPRTRILAALAVLPALLVPAAVPAPAQAAACATRWGSLPESSETTTFPGVGRGTVTDVRAGRHACFDRLVVDVAGSSSGYWVSYVDNVTMTASGDVVPTAGGARLLVVARAPSYDQDGTTTFEAPATEVEPVGGYRTFRQVTWAGSWEGETALGLGVRGRLPFRVLTLAGPGSTTRLVVDVAHSW